LSEAVVGSESRAERVENAGLEGGGVEPVAAVRRAHNAPGGELAAECGSQVNGRHAGALGELFQVRPGSMIDTSATGRATDRLCAVA
jgi:hypothetical protein